MKKHWAGILIVGLTLGTAWAIRGQFGHEEGAAWAGGIGALALVLTAQRKDWYSKILPIAMSSAIGWGAGGMISYGLVVGYGRSTDLLNASYGLLMLFVIGGLFGLLGGGLTGLTLYSSEKNKVRWGSLIPEMTAGGIIAYFFIIGQQELLMTPPRSEAWAVCMGAGAALLWHMARNKYFVPIRVSLYSAIGAGFGFAFGNFLQITGNLLEINFNMWNVMEYSIGFFGGSFMAYAVFSSEWPDESAQPARWENKTAYFVLFMLVPFFVILNSHLTEIFIKGKENAPGVVNVTPALSITMILIILAASLAGWYLITERCKKTGRKESLLVFMVFFFLYILLSYCVTGAFKGIFLLNHHLYIVNYIVITILILKKFPAFFEKPRSELNLKKWLLLCLAIIVIIFLLSVIAANMHGEMGGARTRFPLSGS